MKIDKTISEDLSFFKELLSNLNAVLYILDLDAKTYIWLSDNYLDVVGYDKDEKTLNAAEFADNYFHPDDKTVMKERMDALINNNLTVWSGVYRIKHKKGYWIWVYSKVTVYRRDRNGHPTKLLGIILEIRENFETSEQLSVFSKQVLRSVNHSAINKLTNRELEIISLIAAGNDYQEIAEKLYIQPDTVNKHRKHILEKLNLKNIASLVNFANETGLI